LNRGLRIAPGASPYPAVRVIVDRGSRAAKESKPALNAELPLSKAA
jgi:hypothetical protein